MNVITVNTNTPKYFTPFSGTVNMKELHFLYDIVEPEAIKKITNGNIFAYAKKWINIPNFELDNLLGSHDLNFILKRLNIKILLQKRGYTTEDNYFYDAIHAVTHDNYDLAFLLAQDFAIDLDTMRTLLTQLKSGKMTLEDAYEQYGRISNEYILKQFSGNQQTKRKNGWTKQQFIDYILPKIVKGNFKKSELNDKEVRNLAKLLGTTEMQIRSMDKTEYKRLTKEFHPDKSENGQADIFCILQALYNCK